MDETNLEQLLDHHRWLLNSGLVPDEIKNQLFMYGAIVHKDVLAVDLSVSVEGFLIEYKIYIKKSLLKKIDKFKELQKSSSLWGLWKFKGMLKKEGNLNFDKVIDKFVKDYCGPKWQSTTTVIDYSKYIPDEDIGEDINYHREHHQGSD